MADDIQNNWGAQALDTEQNARRWQHNVHEGCAVTVGANAMAIDVASGTVAVAGTRHTVGATTVTLSASQSDPRKDVIYVDSSGVVQVAEGEPKPARPEGLTGRDTYQPLPPDLSQMDATPLAEVWVGAGVDDITSGDVSDRRQFADLTANTADVESLSAAEEIIDPTGTSYTDLSSLQKVTYRQASEPSSPAEGETWYDTDTGIFRVHADLGSGLDWHPIPPVTVTEEASTFTESDVTVTISNTTIQDNSIALINGAGIFPDDFEDGVDSGWTGDTADLSAVSSPTLAGSQSGELVRDGTNKTVVSPSVGGVTETLGMSVLPNPAEDVFISIYDSSDTSIGLLRFTSGNIDFYSDGEILVENYNDGSTYRFVFDWDFPNDEVDISVNGDDKGTFDLRNTGSSWDYIDIGMNGLSGDTVYIDNYPDAASGEALIGWVSGSPAEIKAWDLATFQRTLDNETVTVDVEDGNGNVLFSDIGPNFDISTVDTTKNVTLRANLSRSDTSNNPTLDYAARRFVR